MRHEDEVLLTAEWQSHSAKLKGIVLEPLTWQCQLVQMRRRSIGITISYLQNCYPESLQIILFLQQ